MKFGQEIQLKASATPPAFPQKKVLILDNDQDILEAMQEVFCYEGFDVKTILDADNMFSIIDEYRPDIILLDYILNGINGGEICHQIKMDPKIGHIPIILLSAYGKVLQSLGYYGCDAFISKPFDLTDLMEQVSGLITQKAS